MKQGSLEDDVVAIVNALKEREWAEHCTTTIAAKWFVIKFSPDLATGELLNIGVGIIYNKQVFTKIIPNTKPFELLYGDHVKENLSFLLDLLKSSTDSLLALNSVSPHVSISSLKFVAGDSVDDMLDRLYKSMILIDRNLNN
ncbi:hypothetical protein [Snodgrassella communis]|jgi:hypothetical protein|uniref:hypothetical protein n=1 Tax=Snodgrassella communis TaxID=2946699 RepID=UPI000C1DFC7F|nr:hypothetical protein [Snodgrassella communis]PIT23601.1 hypothetical protein BGI35_01615 [Snodgrassella communis]